MTVCPPRPPISGGHRPLLDTELYRGCLVQASLAAAVYAKGRSGGGKAQKMTVSRQSIV